MIYAVIDTNVIVSSLITKNTKAATYQVMQHVFRGDVIPLYNQEILDEYLDVLSRKKFKLTHEIVNSILDYFQEFGIEEERFASSENFPDEDDRVFYEISLSVDDSFLVTGNLKHYPQTPNVLSPSDFLSLIEK